MSGTNVDICTRVSSMAFELMEMIESMGGPGSGLAGAMRSRIESGCRKIRTEPRGWSAARTTLAFDCGKLSARGRELGRFHGSARMTKLSRDLDDLLVRLSRERAPAVYFGNTLTPENGDEEAKVLKHRGGDSLPPTRSLRVEGPKGLRVRVSLRHVRGLRYGGHNHDVGNNASFVGSFRPGPGVRPTDYPAGGSELSFPLPGHGAVAELTYRATDFCGRFRVTVEIGEMGARSFPVHVKYAEKLLNLAEIGHPYLNFYSNEEVIHPASHYADTEMRDALFELGYAFGHAYEEGVFGPPEDPEVPSRLWINDISLPWGGLFKIGGRLNRKKKHGEHKWGRNVDINSNRLNSVQIKWMHANVNYFFNNVLFHGNEGAKHWHCTI